MTANRLTFDDREAIRNCRDIDIETDVAQRCLVALEAMEKQDAEDIELLRQTVAVAKGLEKRLVLVHYLVTQTGAENARACGTDLHQGGPNTIDFSTVTCPDCLRAEGARRSEATIVRAEAAEKRAESAEGTELLLSMTKQRNKAMEERDYLRAKLEATEEFLTFERLNHVNRRRCNEVFHECVTDWSPERWALAFVGEAGEACNAVKKLIRGDGTPDAVADEVADTVIYGDLLCQAIGASLEAAIRRKFNAVSDRKGWKGARL